MLPEEAFDLKIGEQITGIGPVSGTKYKGVVASVRPVGASVHDYMNMNFSEIDAIRLQHDGPSIIMQSDTNEFIIWRPDAIERVTGEFVIKCCVCRAIVRIQVPLRVFDKMRAGELVVDNVTHKAMIEQSRCGTHCITGG